MQSPNPMLVQAFQLLQAGRTQEGVLLIHQLAGQGDANAMLTLGEMTWGGMVAQDPVRARDLFRRSALGGNPVAQVNYTNLLANGVAGERDWPEALRRLANEAKGDAKRRAALELIAAMKIDDAGDPLSLPEPQMLSTQPHALLFPRLFTAAECAYLLKAAEPGYQPSTVFDAQRRPVRDTMRTSDGSTLHWLIEDPAIHAINRRLAAISGTDAVQGEAAQILRYRVGQQYRPHFDFVRASDNQRVMTALIYLNHDYKGGETAFIRTDLKVKAKAGDVLLFRNALPDRSVDPLSEHAGMPVTSGTKFLYSRWIRELRWAP